MSTLYRSAIRDPCVLLPDDVDLLVPDATATALAATPTTNAVIATPMNGRRNLLIPIYRAHYDALASVASRARTDQRAPGSAAKSGQMLALGQQHGRTFIAD